MYKGKHRVIKNKRKVKKKIKLNFNVILLILIPIFVIGMSVASYVQKKHTDTVYTAESFYFESDLLSDNTNPSAYTYEIGKNEISIQLTNNIDNLRYAEVDIKYIVTITDSNGNEVVDKNGNKILEKSGTLLKDSINSNIINFSNLKSGVYIVTAKAIKPYTKVLQANFVITEKNNEITYQVNDSINSPVVQLTVMNKDYNGNIKITWPEGVAPDSTNSKFYNVNAGYNRRKCNN